MIKNMEKLAKLHQEVLEAEEQKRELSLDQIAAIEGLIKERWSKSNPEEAQKMVEMMCLAYSTQWFVMMAKAEKQEVAHWKLLMEYGHDIYSSAATAAAAEDGMVYYKK